MNEEIIIAEPSISAVETYSPERLEQQVQLIQNVMKSVMRDGEHYGVIPGCGDKKVLLKAGAEKLLMTFRIAPEILIEDLSTGIEIRYRIICKGLHIGTGAFLGMGIGECSTLESKYRWRMANSEAEYENTDLALRRIKYGSKWNFTKKKNEESQEKQVRIEPADVANTVLKMAKKRALVDLTLTVTAASDIFTQDIEEGLPGEDKVEPQKEKKPYPRQADINNSQQLHSQDGLHILGIEIAKSGKNKNGDWHLFEIKMSDGVNYKTFDADLAESAKQFMDAGISVVIDAAKNQKGYGMDLLAIIEEPQKEMSEAERQHYEKVESEIAEAFPSY